MLALVARTVKLDGLPCCDGLGCPECEGIELGESLVLDVARSVEGDEELDVIFDFELESL